jgi:peptidoglycan L-alanyl-D-glutamate endopeptidase CwlK
MIDQLLSRIDTKKIHPKFLELYIKTLKECEKQGHLYYALSGFRDPKEQQDLYNQGRTTEGKIVTNAEGFKSYHNYGLAIDSCYDSDVKRDGLQPDWGVNKYQVLAKVAKDNGLQSGLYFKGFIDAPHIQYPLPKGYTLSKIKGLYLQGGLEEVWKAI